MAKSLPIHPVFSAKPHKNVYDYWDTKLQRQVKCSGFDLHIWDGQTETLVKRRIKADYQTAKAAYFEMLGLIRDGNESVPTLIKRHRVSTIGDLYKAYERAKSEPTLKNRQG